MNSLKEKKLFKNMGLKIISLIIAVILWLVVMNIDDYSMTRTIRNIPVTQLNGDSITNLGKVYDVVSGSTVDIVVKGPRSVVDSLSQSSFTATADLSQLSITNSVQINVTANDARINNDIEISYVSRTMNLTIEDKVTREMPIRAVAEGEPAEGYALGETIVTPNMIEITGPESIISKVTEVRASINVGGQSESMNTLVAPQCLNAYGEPQNGKSIELGVEEVRVSATIYPTKTIPVRISPEGEPGAGYIITGINYNPQTITVAGEKTKLEQMDALVLATQDLAGATQNTEMNLSVGPALPEGIYLADTNEDIAVNVLIEKLEQREIAVTAKDIELRNTREDLEYSLNISGVYKLRLRGLAKDIDTVTKESLDVYLNVDGKTEGVQDVSPSYTKPSNVDVTLVGRMTLTVTSKEEVTEEVTGESTEEGSSEEGSEESSEEAAGEESGRTDTVPPEEIP